MDIFSKEKRSAVMASIRGKNTKPERLVFRHLRREGIYFQKHYRRAPGCPDVAWPRRKIAVFIDGDFWHGRQFSRLKTRLTNPYWREKIQTNIRRDRRNLRELRALGWKVVKIWESDLMRKRTQPKVLRKILALPGIKRKAPTGKGRLELPSSGRI